MAFEADRGGSGLEPKLAGLRLTPADFRRTPPPDPPGPRTDPGRTRHRTIRTRGTGGAHLGDHKPKRNWQCVLPERIIDGCLHATDACN